MLISGKRGDQGQRADQVRPGGRDLDADRAAERVAEQVHRTTAVLLDQRDDRLG
jgi:hypothetical protein